MSIHIDTSVEGYLHPDSPLIAKYQAFEGRFGEDKILFILVETNNAFDPDFLLQLRQFHEALEGLPEKADTRLHGSLQWQLY